MKKTNELIRLVSEGSFNDTFKKLYLDIDLQKKRYLEAIKEFEEFFGKNRDATLFSAPGRSEIIGNHTDHQHGMAIAAAVDLDIIAVVSLNGTDKINVKSKGYKCDTIDINDTGIKDEEINRSASLVRGIAESFKKKGYSIKGFDAYTTSNVLKGSGLSSSAAFEVLISTIINNLFCNDSESDISKAVISQYAENVYFGKPCGLLDQTASSVGGFVFIDFENPSAPAVEKINFDFEETGYALCITDTGGNHAALTDDYSDVFSELKSICSSFGKDYLRDIPEEEFYSAIPSLMQKTSHRGILRAMHVYDENRRVSETKKALSERDFETFLKLIKESGDSSYKYIQNAYSVSEVKAQEIPVALKLTDKFLAGKGAYRVHGGGFAGTIQAFVPQQLANEYKIYMEKVFGEGKCYILKVRPCGGIRL